MKKLIAILITALFVISAIPMGYAKEITLGLGETITAAAAVGNGYKGGDESEETGYQTGDSSKGTGSGNGYAAENSNKAESEQIKERARIARSSYSEARNGYMLAKENLEKIRNRYNSCKDDVSEECTEIRKQTKEHKQNFLINAADKILGVMDRIKEKIQSSEDMDEEDKAGEIASIEAKISEIESARESIENLDSESTDEEIKEAASSINAAWKKSKVNAEKSVGKLLNSKIHGIIERSEQLEAKLERTLSNLDKEGYDISSAENSLEGFSAKIESAKQSYEKAREQYSGETSEAMKKGNTFMKEAHNSLKEAHNVLKDVLKEIKSSKQSGNTEQNNEAEEEIEE